MAFPSYIPTTNDGTMMLQFGPSGFTAATGHTDLRKLMALMAGG